MHVKQQQVPHLAAKRLCGLLKQVTDRTFDQVKERLVGVQKAQYSNTILLPHSGPEKWSSPEVLDALDIHGWRLQTHAAAEKKGIWTEIYTLRADL